MVVFLDKVVVDQSAQREIVAACLGKSIQHVSGNRSNMFWWLRGVAMNKVMVDTNVWVDVVLNRPQFAMQSRGALMACIQDDIELFVAATSLKDVFCFAEKSAGADAAYRAVELIMDIATLAQVDSIVCTQALRLECPDYEDGIVAACALAENVQVIVSRDVQAFNDLEIRKLTPEALISELGFEEISM